MFEDLHNLTRIGDDGYDTHLLPALGADQWIGFEDPPDSFRPALMLGRSGGHWYSLHHDPLFDQFFTVFALQFATMTAAVDTVVGEQAFVAAGDVRIASRAKNSGTGEFLETT